jgi:hypothetical protein
MMQAAQHVACFSQICNSLATRAAESLAHPRGHVMALRSLLREASGGFRGDAQRQLSPHVSAAWCGVSEAAAREHLRASEPDTLAAAVLEATAAEERDGTPSPLGQDDAARLLGTLLDMCVLLLSSLQQRCR